MAVNFAPETSFANTWKNRVWIISILKISISPFGVVEMEIVVVEMQTIPFLILLLKVRAFFNCPSNIILILPFSIN